MAETKNFLDESGTSYLWGKMKTHVANEKAKVDGYTINGKAINGNPQLTAADVGAAPLSFGKIPEQYLPAFVDDVLEYADDIVMGNITVQQSSTITPTGIYYYTPNKCFIAKDANDAYFANWTENGNIKDAKYYGESGDNGRVPTSGKIYVNVSTNISSRWAGEAAGLVAMASGLALGETEDTAFPGDKGAWIYNSIIQGNPPVVTPVITINWAYYKYDGTTSTTPEKNDGNATSPQIEVGYKAKYTGSFKWTADSGRKNPTETSGTFGTTLPASGVASASKTATVSTNTTISQTLRAPKQGLIVSNGAVTAPTGKDDASASVSIKFLYKRFWGVTTSAGITESVIKGLSSNELTYGKSKTLTGVTANSSQYYVIAYPTALGALTGIIQDGATPVLSAFTQTTVSVTNAAGYTQDYYVYRSNNVGAFTNVKLALS